MNSTLRARSVFLTILLTLLGWLSSPAHAQAPTILSVTPGTGPYGTSITIAGTGFTKKPSVLLTSDGSPKKYTLKVTSFTETEIVAEFRGAPSGTYDLNVKVKNATATDLGGFIVPAPEPSSLSAASGAPKTQITISGDKFGTKKGKVTFSATAAVPAAKLAKVITWTNTSVVLEVPKLPAGNYNVNIINSASQNVAGIFGVTSGGGGGGGGLKFKCKIDGAALVFAPADFNLNANLLLANNYNAHAGTPPPIKEVNVNFTHNIVSGGFPQEVSGTQDALIEYAEVVNSNVNIWRTAPGANFSINLISNANGKLTATFSGPLTLFLGTGPNVIQLTDGEFELTIP